MIDENIIQGLREYLKDHYIPALQASTEKEEVIRVSSISVYTHKKSIQDKTLCS